MYGYNNYDSLVRTSSSVTGVLIWTIISVIAAIGGGIALYLIFLKNDKKKYTGFLAKLKDFLNFKVLLLEDILKISYLIIAIFITLFSFGLIGTSVISFLVTLIGGNLALRISYELSILLIKICQNTSEINSKLKK